MRQVLMGILIASMGVFAPVAGAQPDIAAQTPAVEKVARDFAEAWNRHDMAALAELFAEDAQFVNVVGLWWKGREQIRAAHAATHATMFKDSHLAIDSVSVRFLKPDVAIARSAWQLTGHRSPSGENLPPRHGLLVHVLVRSGARWQIVDSQNTDIVAGVLAPPQ